MILCLGVTIYCLVTQKKFIKQKYSSLILARTKLRNEKLYWYPFAILITTIPKAIDTMFTMGSENHGEFNIFGLFSFFLWGSSGLFVTLTYEWLKFRMIPDKENRTKTLLGISIETGEIEIKGGESGEKKEKKKNLRESLLSTPTSNDSLSFYGEIGSETKSSSSTKNSGSKFNSLLWGEKMRGEKIIFYFMELFLMNVYSFIIICLNFFNISEFRIYV